jgi:hypothetical protein
LPWAFGLAANAMRILRSASANVRWNAVTVAIHAPRDAARALSGGRRAQRPLVPASEKSGLVEKIWNKRQTGVFAPTQTAKNNSPPVMRQASMRDSITNHRCW